MMNEENVRGDEGDGDETAREDVIVIETIEDDSALVLVRHLESEPLAAAAGDIRRRLFNWLISSDGLPDFDASTKPIERLEASPYRYRDELMMQFLFGGAAWRLAEGKGRADLDAQQEAGIRSMIAAYRNIVQQEPGARDELLDWLDGLRRSGDLRRYIQQSNSRRGP